MTIEEIILNAYDKADRAIGDSDLDDEQPLSLNIRLTLGDIRSLRRWRSWLVGGENLKTWGILEQRAEKIPKAGPVPEKFILSDEELDRAEYVVCNNYRISEIVRRCNNYDVLKAIEKLLETIDETND